MHGHAIHGLFAKMVYSDADTLQHILVFAGHVIDERRDGVKFAKFVVISVPLAAISYCQCEIRAQIFIVLKNKRGFIPYEKTLRDRKCLIVYKNQILKEKHDRSMEKGLYRK